MRERAIVAVLSTSTLLLAACSGGGGGGGSISPGTPPSNSQPSSSTQAVTESSVADTNAVGSPVSDFLSYDSSFAPSGVALATDSRTRMTAGSGTCNNGVEFYAPDRNGDANSTETLDFYDSACTVLARDAVRIYTPTSSSSETVNVNVKIYAPGSSTPIATRTDARVLTAATFGSNGFPTASDGFDLTANSSLNLASSRTIVSGREFVLEPASSATQSFCSDSAGYNATGFAKLNETFGWQGGVLSGGTRTVNSDGSVTWAATHAGTTFKGPIGGLSIDTGTQNTTCPIATPMFTLGGGTSTGTYSIPVTITYLHGMIENLTITGATLANGTTLTVQTNSTAAPTSPAFITGTITKNGTQVAAFGVDAYGYGILTVTSTGVEYVIVAWHVVH